MVFYLINPHIWVNKLQKSKKRHHNMSCNKHSLTRYYTI